MALLTNKSADYGVRVLRICVVTVLWVTIARAQQSPFVPIANAPKGCYVPYEAKSGGLWLAGCQPGSEGLLFFDGTRFLSPLKGTFPSIVVNGLAEDSEGGIWLSSEAGIYRYSKGQLEKKIEGVALAGITAIADDVFLATVADSSNDAEHKAALLRIARTAGAWKADTIEKPVAQVQYLVDQRGQVLFGCEGGYCEIAADEVAHWHPGAALPIRQHRAPTTASYAIYESAVWRDRLGCIWMRSRSDASYQCPADRQPVTLPLTEASIGIATLFELPDGSIGIPSLGKLTIGRPGNFRVLTAENGCPTIFKTFVGRDNSLWITSTAGVFVLPLHTRMESWSGRDGLNGTTWSVIRAGKKMFALADVSTRVLNDDRTHWRVQPGIAGRLFPGPGDTAIVVSSNGVSQVSPEWKVLRGSRPLQVWLATRAADGSLVAAGEGVYKLRSNGGAFNVQPVGPEQHYIQGVVADRDGEIWTCSGAGLSEIRESGWRTLTTKDGLLQNGCGTMTEDRQGDLWMAYDTITGFARIHDPRSARPEIEQFQNGGNHGRTYFFATDHQGRLWRGASDGVYVADLEQARQGRWLHLDRTDGFPAIDTNQHSFFEDSDGSVWFGAEDSIIHLFPPDDLVRPTTVPTIFVSSFSWTGKPDRMADLAPEFENSQGLVAHIGSLQFDRRNALQIRYRMLPGQSAWSSADGLDVRLGKLAWGGHTLEVQARLGDGPWSASAAKSFTVLRPIWLSWPALLGFVAVGGLGIAGGVWQRRRRQARERTMLPELAEWRLASFSPEMQNLSGTLLDGRFEVGRVLARGGFATVAEGKDLEHDGRRCAIKIFRQELMDKDWMARRFQQEVLALEQVRHPNVVGIYGHGTTPGGAPYLVMEYVDGRTLRELLESGTLARRDIASYLRQTGSALDQIHAHGVCHRDLKPENLMIRNAAVVGEELVLIDFSIAIVKDPDETLHGLSRAAGTIYYMAPEQAIGYADSSTDIYSLTKILIEMLTGQRLSALLPDASIDLPVRVRDLLTVLPVGLSEPSITSIGAALEYDPSRRPQCAGEFTETIARDLETMADDGEMKSSVPGQGVA
jgi:tRNA A-37 threonylcarbamoyl transferase component Bud32